MRASVSDRSHGRRIPQPRPRRRAQVQPSGLCGLDRGEPLQRAPVVCPSCCGGTSPGAAAAAWPRSVRGGRGLARHPRLAVLSASRPRRGGCARAAPARPVVDTHRLWHGKTNAGTQSMRTGSVRPTTFSSVVIELIRGGSPRPTGRCRPRRRPPRGGSPMPRPAHRRAGTAGSATSGPRRVDRGALADSHHGAVRVDRPYSTRTVCPDDTMPSPLTACTAPATDTRQERRVGRTGRHLIPVGRERPTRAAEAAEHGRAVG